MKKTLWIYIIALAWMCIPQKSQGQFYGSEEQFRLKQGFNTDYIVLFTEQPDKRRIRIFASVVYDNLQFVKKDSVFSANYRITFSVLNKDGNFIIGDRIDREIVTSDYFETNSRQKFDWIETNLDLAPGDYKLTLIFLDKDSRASDTIEREIKISSLSENGLLIAGPILLDTVQIDDKGMVSLQPGLSGAVFDGKKSIWAYYEVMSKEYPADINIKYHLIDSKGRERVTGDFTRHLDSPVLRDRFSVDLKEFDFDDYQLVLQAECSDKSASSSKKFRIHWPELPATIRDLDKAIDQLVYIASEREIARLKEEYLGRRLEMFLDYWKKWGSGEAESFKLMDEYYRRIYEANQLFSEGGWKCDRGHVYVLYGIPSEIDRHPYDLYSKAYEVWYYFEDNRRFIFVDEGGFGDYRLQSPLWQN